MAPSASLRLSLVSLCAYTVLGLPHNSNNDNDIRPDKLRLPRFDRPKLDSSISAGAVNHAVPSKVVLFTGSGVARGSDSTPTPTTAMTTPAAVVIRHGPQEQIQRNAAQGIAPQPLAFSLGPLIPATALQPVPAPNRQTPVAPVVPQATATAAAFPPFVAVAAPAPGDGAATMMFGASHAGAAPSLGATLFPPLPIEPAPKSATPLAPAPTPSFNSIVPMASIMPPLPVPQKSPAAPLLPPAPSAPIVVPMASIMPPLQPSQPLLPQSATPLVAATPLVNPFLNGLRPTILLPPPPPAQTAPLTVVSVPSVMPVASNPTTLNIVSKETPLLFTLQPTSLIPVPPKQPSSAETPKSASPVVLPSVMSTPRAPTPTIPSATVISPASTDAETVTEIVTVTSGISKSATSIRTKPTTSQEITSSTSLNQSAEKSSASSSASSQSLATSKPSPSLTPTTSAVKSTSLPSSYSKTPTTVSLTPPQTTSKPDISGRPVGVIVLSSVTYTIGILSDGNLQFGSGAIVTANAPERVVDGQTLSFGVDGLIVNHASTFPIKAAVPTRATATATATSSSSASKSSESAKSESSKSSSSATSSRATNTRKGGISSPTGGFSQGVDGRLDSAGQRVGASTSVVALLVGLTAVLYAV